MKTAIEKRQIKYILHFTRLENLASILSNGIIPRGRLETHSVNAVFNDNYRIDGEKEANCFSIGHPNYKLFFSLRRQFPEQEWVVLACDPNILWLKDCAFCYENAASTNVTAIPLPSRKGVAAFENLFCPAEGKPSRTELNLPDNYPTNPQAEILVFDIIEPEYIFGGVCEKSSLKDELSIKYPRHQFVHKPHLFRARVDYAHWK